MLQIIGWLGCVYLLVKALAIAGSNDSYSPSKSEPEKHQINTAAGIACLVSVVAAIGFLFLFSMQGASVSRSQALSDFSAEFYPECIRQAEDIEAITACGALLR